MTITVLLTAYNNNNNNNNKHEAISIKLYRRKITLLKDDLLLCKKHYALSWLLFRWPTTFQTLNLETDGATDITKNNTATQLPHREL